MSELIDKDAFLKQERKWYCENCDRRKGVKNGRKCFVYEIGEVPCRACDVDDVLDDLEDFPTASPWHRVEDGLPKDDCEVFTASRLPFDKTDTWIYEHSFFTTDVSECEELKDEYPNEHKAAFYKWSDISDEYVICHYGLKYWMPIEPPKEDA